MLRLNHSSKSSYHLSRYIGVEWETYTKRLLTSDAFAAVKKIIKELPVLGAHDRDITCGSVVFWYWLY